ncbi:MAG TPA: glutamate synthase subunit beta [Gaiellaceae bacterium]|jgi:glutamate synthase (NADPH/NADH) small chain
MGELGAFLKIGRAETPERAPRERVGDHREFVHTLPLVELREQGARCMECGVPFCHSGCPLGNLIPDWNDLVYRDRFREALDQLHRTNNFPEFTGRLCPAPCEAACVLEIDEGNAVTIKQIERAIVDRGWDEGWIVPRPPARRTSKTVVVVGSGPAGLAAAQQLNRAGHLVTVLERDEEGGGLLRFGVPDFKIEKTVVERRLQQLRDEGVEFRFGTEVTGPLAGFDATVLATGSRIPRDLPVPGRELGGVHFAMEYLYGRNRAVAGTAEPAISAAGRHVIVIGGGDTGADCVASAHREGASTVTQIELLGEPPERRPDDLTPWPLWPMKLRTSYALKEGGDRSFAVSTTGLSGNGSVQQIHWLRNSGTPPFDPVSGTDESHPAQLVLLAMGFIGPEPALLDTLGVARDARGNVDATEFATSVPGVFAAGDARRGQSLIVWAIDEGRRCARVVDDYLS